ncbi:MAG: hypothetical protein WD669_09170 [Pirellulales bacterium]
MSDYLPLIVFAVAGFSVWFGIVKLWTIYEERAPLAIQEWLYKRAKNLPGDAIDLVLSCLFWSGLGALPLRVVLGLVGLDDWLPDTSWALPVVAFFFFGALLSFWDSPARKKEAQPRGRGLGPSAQKPAPPGANRHANAPSNTRGRTIRSYQDIK